MAARQPNPRSPGAGAEIYDLGLGLESTAQRVARPLAEARMLAREQVETLSRDLNALGARAKEFADGGDAYPAGVRELAPRIADDLRQEAPRPDGHHRPHRTGLIPPLRRLGV